jgi:uncharacterized protein YbaR (Trm112 family)
MPRYVLFERQLIWLQTHGYLLTCPLCNEPIKNNQEVRSFPKNKVIYHVECFDKEESKKKAILQSPKFTSNFTENQYFCYACKKNTKAIVFRERFGTRILGLICPLCGEPLMYSETPSFYKEAHSNPRHAHSRL